MRSPVIPSPNESSTRSPRALTLISVLLAGALTACDEPDPAPAVAGVAPGTQVAFVERPCHFKPSSPFTARCGHVVVPENRAQPQGGRQVTLAVAIFAASGRPATKADPLVYLAGGPGGRAIESVAPALEVFAPVAMEMGRELVVIDQRGTGLSTPRLDCAPELHGGGSVVAACRKRLGEQAALEHYGTAANASDMEDVRRALGMPPWNLLGVSYGSRLALEVMRLHPAGLRSVIIDGVAPPDINWVSEVPLGFDRMLHETAAACARDERCKTAYPQLDGAIVTLAETLERTPKPIRLSSGDQFPLDGKTLLSMVHLMAYDATALGLVPRLLGEVQTGVSPILELVLDAMAGDRGVDIGMHLSVVCAEVVTLPVRMATSLATGMLSPVVQAAFTSADSEAYCAEWNVPRAPAALGQPVASAVPTLVLSGHFDPITPPSFARHAAMTLSNYTELVVPDSGHGAFVTECGATAIGAFLADPAKVASPAGRPAAACATVEPRLSFLLPPDPRRPGESDRLAREDVDTDAERVARLRRKLELVRGR